MGLLQDNGWCVDVKQWNAPSIFIHSNILRDSYWGCENVKHHKTNNMIVASVWNWAELHPVDVSLLSGENEDNPFLVYSISPIYWGVEVPVIMVGALRVKTHECIVYSITMMVTSIIRDRSVGSLWLWCNGSIYNPTAGNSIPHNWHETLPFTGVWKTSWNLVFSGSLLIWGG